MAGKLTGGGILIDAVGVTLDVLLVSSTVFTEITGQLAAGLTLAYWRQGGAVVTFGASDLALLTSAWAAGGWKEASAANAPGLYRLDLPDAAFAAGSPTPDWVTIIVKVASVLAYYERIPLVTAAAAGGDATAAAQATILANLATVAGYVDTEVAAIKAKTDLITGSPAVAGAAMALTPTERDAAAAALLDLVDGLETDLTVREGLRASAAHAAGDLVKLGSSLVLKSLDGAKDRATATVDATTGARTVTARDLE